MKICLVRDRVFDWRNTRIRFSSIFRKDPRYRSNADDCRIQNFRFDDDWPANSPGPTHCKLIICNDVEFRSDTRAAGTSRDRRSLFVIT